jgi:hypothetical protein
MNTCAIRKGFLTLRNCGNPAARNCETCKRPVCTQHLASSSGFVNCLECAAGKIRDDTKVDQTSPEAAYLHRRRYYDDGYTPIYFGSTYSDYDDYDVRSFDTQMNAGALDHDDGTTASFGDS